MLQFLAILLDVILIGQLLYVTSKNCPYFATLFLAELFLYNVILYIIFW